MNDNLVTICVALVCIVLAASPVACSMNDNYAVTEMVRSGANPMDAKCAVKALGSPDPFCILRAAGKEAAK